MPLEIYVSTDIGAAPEVVWPYLVDWENLGRWMLEASEFEVVSPEREGVGVEAEATVKILGIKTRDRVRVTGWEPPHLLIIDHLGWVKGQGLIRLFGHDGNTHVYWRETLEPPMSVFGDVGIRAFKGVMRRIFQRDLDELRQLVVSDHPR